MHITLIRTKITSYEIKALEALGYKVTIILKKGN